MRRGRGYDPGSSPRLAVRDSSASARDASQTPRAPQILRFHEPATPGRILRLHGLLPVLPSPRSQAGAGNDLSVTFSNLPHPMSPQMPGAVPSPRIQPRSLWLG